MVCVFFLVSYLVRAHNTLSYENKFELKVDMTTSRFWIRDFSRPHHSKGISAQLQILGGALSANINFSVNFHPCIVYNLESAAHFGYALPPPNHSNMHFRK